MCFDYVLLMEDNLCRLIVIIFNVLELNVVERIFVRYGFVFFKDKFIVSL